ncbi:MAG: IS66 family insertion sequence element accessory protein TnpB [Oscillospiraceae bacterium]|nr:IS66 family insertion sequence element accessory protein TnpB [Oscillospiraceae bacterium]
MLRDGTGFKKVIICCGKVDLRRGIDGLVAYVRLNYGLNPIEKGTLFLFCGNRADRIKGLLFEGDGMLLLYKRLAEGNRFHWPRTPKEAREIDADMYRSLMEGNLLVGTIKEVFPQQER